MRSFLPSRLIGTIIASAIVLATFTAMPVYADDERTARVIATILGLAVVGKIIHDERKDKKQQRRVSREADQAKVHQRHTNNGHGNLNNTHRRPNVYNNGHGQPKPRPLPRRVDRKQLPKQCFRSYETRNGRFHMFARRCLERNFAGVNRLPQNCAQRVRTRDGARRGYDARCLRRNGYSLARG